MNDTDLALLLDRFMRRIHFGLQARAPEFDKEAVGPSGGIVLMTLAETGSVALSELTKRVARDKSQMTRTIRALERKGLVHRVPSTVDGRVTLVALTGKGQGVVDDFAEAVADVTNEILNPISDEEKRTLKHLITRVVV